MNEDNVYLSQEQERNVINALCNYVIRVTDSNYKASPAELNILPEVANWLLNVWHHTSDL